jgi:diguanylate cyclase (GGDEF)-like protein
MTRVPAVSISESIAIDSALEGEVRAALVETLFASQRSLIIGALTGGAIALLVAQAVADIGLWICAGLVVLVGGLRIVASLRSTRPALASARESGFRVGAWFYSGALGLFGCATLIRAQDPTLHLLAVATVIGYAAGIASRNAGRPTIAIGQVVLALVPVVVGLGISGNPLLWALAVIILLFGMAMLEIMMTLYRIILKAMATVQKSAAEADINAMFARLDSLTGLANRFAFNERLNQLLGDCGPQARLCLHWFDLDKFKEVNDTHGHMIGDALLAEIGTRLRGAFAESAIVARLGGDEFALVSRMSDIEEPAVIGERIKALVRAPFMAGDAKLLVTASVGVAIAPDDGGTVDEMLRHADLALYRSKANGRHLVGAYEPGTDAGRDRRLALEYELRHALTRGEFERLYQPIRDLRTGAIRSCETLLRWNSARFGAVSPSEFIPIAEDIGMIGAIGEWVLRGACRDAGDWPHDVRVAVNLSAAQVRGALLPTMIMSALQEAGLAHERLELEITESVFLQDAEGALSILQSINAVGVRTILDDFGTGFSSLSYLTRYPFQALKIDRSFVSGLDRNPHAIAIIRTVVELARTLGLETIAEGIETASQFEQVGLAGCVAGQGYLLARPFTAAEVREWLAATPPSPIGAGRSPANASSRLH